MIVPLVLVGVASLLLYYLFLKPSSFWTKYGIPQYPYGSLTDNIDIFLGRKTTAYLDTIFYNKLGSRKLGGFVQMGQPTILIKDLDIAKQILIKDFDYFVDRRNMASGQDAEIVEKMLGNLQGEEWKGVRSSMSPAFTTGKIRRMMDHFNSVGHEWMDHLKQKISAGNGVFDLKVHKEVHHYALDAIAVAGFGLNPGTIKNDDSHFYKMVRRLVDFNPIMVAKFALCMNFPTIMKLFRLSLFDKVSMDYFGAIIDEGLKARKEGKGKMNDFIQLILEARKGEVKGVGKDELSQFEKEAQVHANEKKNHLVDDNVAKAQLIVFFFAGFSATANFIGFLMYLLALNKDVQEKLRKEVNERLFKGKEKGEDIDYDLLNSLPYLEMVVCEVLRKYPPAGRLERKCVKDYHLQSENVKIPKDSLVTVSVHAVHHDKQYYEKPYEFYPEHFNQENKAKRNPYAYIPFGSGPRNCIGMRFALVEGKAAIAHLIHNFIIEPASSTPNPVKVKNIAFGVQIPDNLELRLRPAN